MKVVKLAAELVRKYLNFYSMYLCE